MPKLEHFEYILGHLDKNEENLGVMDFTAQKEFVLCTNALGYPVHEFYDVFFRYLAVLHGEINFFSWLWRVVTLPPSKKGISFPDLDA